jgi:hypothetical protein
MLALKNMFVTLGLATSFIGLLVTANPIVVDNNDLAIHMERSNALDIASDLTKRAPGPCEYELPSLFYDSLKF